METACVDGELVSVADASVPVTDDGLLRGDGVFEVIRLYDGVPFSLAGHLQRMARSAHNLRLALDVEELALDVEALLPTHSGDGLLRLVATRGGHRIALIEPLREAPPALALGYVTFAPARVLDGVKSLSYAANMLATRLARERGFDEALLVTPHRRVLELPTASLFWVAGGRVHTPPLSEHILDSITRQIVIELADAHETPTATSELESADEAFAASSAIEIVAVNRIEQHELPRGGPLTRSLADALRARIEAETRPARR